MTKTEAELRCHRLLNKVGELVQEGKRDPEGVARALQVIKDKPDFESVLFPEDKGAQVQLKEGFDRLLAMPAGLTLVRIVEVMRKSMKVEVYIDLSRVTSERKPDHDYAIWLRDCQEADEELKNLSANDLQQKGIPNITLPERLV